MSRAARAVPEHLRPDSYRSAYRTFNLANLGLRVLQALVVFLVFLAFLPYGLAVTGALTLVAISLDLAAPVLGMAGHRRASNRLLRYSQRVYTLLVAIGLIGLVVSPGPVVAAVLAVYVAGSYVGFRAVHERSSEN